MYIAKTITGLEDISAEELKGKVILPQTVLFKKLKKDPRTVDTIYNLFKQFTFSSINDIASSIKDITKSLDKKTKYDIFCLRKGSHQFKSVDVAKEFGMTLRENGFKIYYKDPKKTIIIDIIDQNCLIGLLVKNNICKRPYRIKYNNRSISSCIAASLIKMANAKKKDVILDPLCKDAIIPLEAYKQGIANISAIDPLKNNIRNAVINCRYAKTKIIPQCYEINWLDTLFKKHSINHIITNMLISKRDEEPEKLIKEFFHQAEFVVKDSITIITNKPDLIKNVSSSFKLAKEIKVSVGEMYYTILKYTKN